jgi:hypothetical protein
MPITRKQIPVDSFPGYPSLKRRALTERGYATLLEVNATSDGYLIGMAKFDSGEVHSVFLGEKRVSHANRREWALECKPEEEKT